MTTATIRYFQPRSLLIGLVMLLAAGLAVLMTPTRKVADGAPAINLDAMIPKAFGDWKVDEKAVALPVAPDVRAKLDKIYSQTLTRTYVNGKGERIMLSIAYGSDQSDGMSVHKPEVCYPAQGFQVIRLESGILKIPTGTIPIKKLVAKQGNRIEPITYWITVGQEVVQGQWSRKIAQMKVGLTGKVPDGLLFRVSSISDKEADAFKLQVRFIEVLLTSIESSVYARLVGMLPK